jgi:3'-phosphoadenosine 5'-phosphosulfate sulfotransferase (PAPS reductase)/FAD synthetase
MKRFLSLGAGVQSSTVALMIAHGELEPVEAAIFADTGWESPKVYEWLEWLEKQLPFPVHRVQRGNLREDILNKREGVRLAACRGTW